MWLHDRRNRRAHLLGRVDRRWPGWHRTYRRTRTRTLPADSGWGIRRSSSASRGACSSRRCAAGGGRWARSSSKAIPAGFDEQQFVGSAHELARQLSVSIENVQLLEEFLQQRRLLEDTFNSLVDLVVVVDASLQVVQMNGAFAARVNLPPG